ncbi:MAG: hypothetical protein P4L83_04690 [Nevskia sp.]|nr:hypothetical protein [Nevskia sp.]
MHTAVAVAVDRTRSGAVAGLIFMVLLNLALFLPGAPPRTDDTVASLASILAQRRAEVTAGSYIAGLAAVAFFRFLGTVRAHLRSAEPASDGLADTAFAGGVAGMVLILLAMTSTAGLALVGPVPGDAGLVRAVTDAANIAINTAKLCLVGLVLAVCLGGRRGRWLPPWLVGSGYASAAVVLLTAGPPLLVRGGLFEFGGPVEIGGVVPVNLWIVALCIFLLRRRSRP